LTRALFLPLLILSLPAQAQVSSPEPSAMDAGLQIVSQSFLSAAKGADFQEWHSVVTLRDAWGNTTQQTNFAYLELETGMHYPADGQWLPSRELVEAYPGGAIARQGGHKIIFAENLNSAVAVDLETPDGKRLQSRVLGLAYADVASGKSVLIAEVADSIGKIIATNQVAYPSAFKGFAADVRYTYTKAGFEQDVILRERPPTPESFGLESKTTRLQVLTEFLSPPQPVVETTKITTDSGELEDQSLDFGAMRMGRGKAFTLSGEKESTPAVPVGKQWGVVEGRTILIEEVAVPQIAEQLDTLPAPVKKSAGLWKKSTTRQMASTKRMLPAAKAAKPSKRAMQMAKLDAPHRGLVLDYVIMADRTDFTFCADTNYLVNGLVNLSGTTTIEGGTVVKFANSSNAKISVGGAGLVCQTGPYRPAVFTSKDDNSVGEVIADSSGTPINTGATYLEVSSGSNPVKYMRFCYAGTALSQIYYAHPVWHCQFVSNNIAIGDNPMASSGVQALHNVLLSVCNVAVANTGSGGSCMAVRAEHVTADQIAQFLVGGCTSIESALTNSLLTAVGVLGASFTLDHSDHLPSGAGVFINGGTMGNYYLADSTYRGSGNPNINPALRDDLKQTTTCPPEVRTAHFTSDTTLNRNPAVLRDTGDNPDRGYHYDALDYCWTGLNVNNATLTLSDGVAIGFYGQYATVLQAGSKIVSAGSPVKRNQLARYNSVQEQHSAWGSSSSSMALLRGTCDLAMFNYTDVSFLAASTYRRYFLWFISATGSDQWFMKDCDIRGAFLPMGGLANGKPTIRFTNNIFDRCQITLTRWAYDFPLVLLNNLFRGGATSTTLYSPAYYWSLANNLFTGVTLTWSGAPPPNICTAYHQTTALPSNPGPIYTIGTADFQTGPLGSYYYPATANGNNLFTLIDVGSGTSASLGLNSHTTQTDQTADSGPVDIGFHYVALEPPTATGASIPVCRNDSIEFDLSGSSPQGYPLTYAVASGPDHGALVRNGAHCTYTPSLNYCGEDSFTFTVNDGWRNSAPATVSITVGQKPSADPGTRETCKNTPLNFNVTGSDPCSSTPTFALVSGPAHAQSFSLSPNGSVSYMPETGFCGLDSFDFKVVGDCEDSDPATVTVRVGKKPSAGSTSVETCKNTSLNYTLTASDPCNEPLTFSLVSGPSQAQSFSLSPSGSVSYTPGSDYCGPDNFQFKVSNGCQDSDPAWVNITVGKKPSATPVTVWTCKNTPLNFNVTGSDPCSSTPTFALVSGSGPDHAQSFSLSPNGSVSYTPAVDFVGQDSFQFKALGDCEDSDPATVTIQVDQPPQAQCQDVMVKKGESITFNLTGSGGAPLTFTLVPGSGPNHAQTFTLAPDGQVTYTPASGYEGPDGFYFTVSSCGLVSGQAHVTLNVVPGPTLTSECRQNRIVLRWTVPEWVEQASLITGFRIYRCTISSGNCVPNQLIHTVTDPNSRMYVDAGLLASQTYCYAVSFSHQDSCSATTTYESPLSSTACNQPCSPPLAGPTDVAFIVDNTGSMGGALQNLKQGIATALDDIAIASNNDYRLALVTPDHDQVNVRVSFPVSGSNRSAFESALNSLSAAGGSMDPESTDECLNTIVHALTAAERTNPDGCPPELLPLQTGDFTSFRSNARRLVVIITDNPPTGFCDHESFDPAVDGQRAHNYAQDARNASPCIKMNAILVTGQEFENGARTVMQDYATTTCGWISELPASGDLIEEAVINMLYSAGACSCP
jgi:hypothetical protein